MTLPARVSSVVTWTVLVAALLGAGVLVTGEWTALSGTLVVVCLAAIIAGVTSVAVWGWTEARGEGQGRLRAVGRALRIGSRALWELLMP